MECMSQCPIHGHVYMRKTHRTLSPFSGTPCHARFRHAQIWAASEDLQELGAFLLEVTVAESPAVCAACEGELADQLTREQAGERSGAGAGLVPVTLHE